MAAARDGAEVFRKIVDLAPWVVIIVDEVGTITFCRGNVEAYAGYTPDELVGTNILDHIDVAWNPVAVDSVAAAMQGHGLRRPMLFRIFRKDGSRVIIETTANSQMDDPDIKGLVGYMRPCDERALIDEVLEAIAGSAPLTETLELLVQLMGAETLEADGAVLYDFDGNAARRAVAAPGLPSVLTGQEPLDVAPWTTALETATSCRVPVKELTEPLRTEAAQRGYAWCWAFPVATLNGLDACLVLWRRLDEDVDETCGMAMTRLVRLTGLVLDREQAAADLMHAAHHDSLTGLPNRTQFFAGLQHALETDGPTAYVGVLYIDLDGFKPVNDQFGHGAGDEVLRVVAQRLRGVVRSTEVVSRFGGDEFTILCPSVFDTEVLTLMAERIISVVSEPIELDDLEVTIGASVGIGVATRSSCSIDAIVDAADAALYQAKQGGKGRWRMSAPVTS